MAERKKQVWLPLESNPDSFNSWSQSLGLDTRAFSFQDCYGLDPELLSFVKQPVKAVLMLFPLTPAYEELKIAKDKEIQENGVLGVEDVLFFKQTIGNACGTMALLHALGNSGVPLEPGILTDLFAQAKDKTPWERSELLETSEGLASVHDSVAHAGQTETPALDDQVDLHFVTFIEHNKQLIELDGRRAGPVNHGPIREGLLEDTAEIVKRVIELTNSIQFNLVTLSPTE